MNSRILLPILTFLTGAAVARYYLPRIEHQVQVQEKVVERVDVRTVTRIVERPDGTKETTIDSTDKSKVVSDTKASETKFVKSQWIAGLSVGSKLLEISPVYTISVDKRIVGPVFAGAYARTDAEAGLSLRLEF